MPAIHSIDAFVAAFNARDLATAVGTFDAGALFEMPLLGQRLVGREEIRAGLCRMFDVAATCSIELDAIRHLDTVAIAEGRFKARLHRDQWRDQTPASTAMALVAEQRRGSLVRLSAYMNTRGQRLWADGPIFGGPPREPG